MKKLLINSNLLVEKGSMLMFVFLILGCSSTKLISSWKNPDYYAFNPKKILVIGVTPNYEARKYFEFQVITQLNTRKINALQSAVVFETAFQNAMQTEAEIEAEVDKLIANGYDTVMVSLVKGRDDNDSYSGDSPKTDYYLRRFSLYYLAYQESYFKQDYYNSYEVLNIEASIYNLKNNSDKSLVWRGTFDMVDINNTNEVIDSYVEKLIRTLEKDKIIPTK